jgi:integrase/recombinase XerD
VLEFFTARVNAVIGMTVADYFTQGRRDWVRLHEKGVKEHAVPCNQSLERLLDNYIEAAGIAGASNGPALWQQDVYRMIQRRAAASGIKTKIGNHTFRATGITAYLKKPGYAGARADDRQSCLAQDDEAL